MNLQAYLLLAAALFSIGLYGILTRRNAVGILVSIELMANAANLNLVAFGRYLGTADGQLMALFTTAITVAEAAIGLALVVLLYRARQDVNVDGANALKG